MDTLFYTNNIFYKEVKFNKQILEELSDVKFLCDSFHVYFKNCCRNMDVG